MKVKNTLLVLILLFSKASFSQNQKDNSAHISDKISSSGMQNPGGEMGVKMQEGGNEKYIQAGIRAESQLSDQKITSDKDLQSREFIINRSPDMKIIYTPNPVKQN